MKEKWVVQSTYGGERLTDESSDSPYSVVLPENGSYPEDIICEVWGTERDDIATAQSICDAHNLAPTQGADAQPFANCRYRICDLPGQCRDEGHCHHPASGERGADARPALTDDQVEKGWHATFSTGNPYCPCNLTSFTKAVRWAERTIMGGTKS